LAPSAEVAKLRERIAAHVDFCRPVTGGYAVVGARGDHKPFVSVPGRSSVSGFTPDYSGHYWTEIDHGKDGDRLRVMVGLGDRRPFEVYGAPWNGTASAKPPTIDWAAKDGHSFFVRVGADAAQWSICGSEPRRVWSASHVQAFAFSPRSRFVVSKEDPRTLKASSFQAAADGAQGTIDLPFAPDRLVLGDVETELIATRHDETSKGITQAMVIDTTRTGTRALDLPNGIRQLTSLTPLRGTGLLLAEVWRGDERRDGTELTDFVAWDPSSGRVTTLFRNEEALLVHELPTNTIPAPGLCR